MTDENPQAQAGEAPQFAIVRVYLKDASFEAPNSPQVFTQDFTPEVGVQLNTSVNKLENDLFEVVLSVTVTSKQDDKVGFLAEVHQVEEQLEEPRVFLRLQTGTGRDKAIAPRHHRPEDGDCPNTTEDE